MNFNYRPYTVTVGFKNDGAEYGRETYRILATDEDQAERKALANAAGSPFDDARLPDRRITVLKCEMSETADESA